MTHEAYPPDESPLEDDSRWPIEELLLYELMERNVALRDLFDVVLAGNGLHLAKPIRLMIHVLTTRLETDRGLTESKKQDYKEVITWLTYLNETINARQGGDLSQAEINQILGSLSL